MVGGTRGSDGSKREMMMHAGGAVGGMGGCVGGHITYYNIQIPI